MESLPLLGNRRIFVVEDNIENRFITRMILTKHGATVAFEIFGRTALGKLKEFGAVDLILLDLMIKYSSGYTVFDQIREVRAYDAVPIVAVSAADPSVAIPECMRKGFNGFIAKPIDADLFPRQLAQAIAGTPIWSQGGVIFGSS